MATQDKSTISGSHDVNQRNIRTIVSGMVSVVDMLEHHNYTILDYPVKKVELIHVKLKDDDNVFDAFMQALSTSVPVPGDIYVQRGFFLQVYGMLHILISLIATVLTVGLYSYSLLI